MKGCMLLTLIFALLYGVALAGYKECHYSSDCPRTKGKCFFFKCIKGKCVRKYRRAGFTCQLYGCHETAECDGKGRCICKKECDEETNCVSDECTERTCDKYGFCVPECKDTCYDKWHNEGHCEKGQYDKGCGVCKAEPKCDVKTNCKSDACTTRKCDTYGTCVETCNTKCYEHGKEGHCEKGQYDKGCGECKVEEKDLCEKRKGCKCELSSKTCPTDYSRTAMTTYDYGLCYEPGYRCCCPLQH